MTRPGLEGLERGLDFAEPLVDLIGQFVGVLILRLELVEFGVQARRRVACSSAVRSAGTPSSSRKPWSWP